MRALSAGARVDAHHSIHRRGRPRRGKDFQNLRQDEDDALVGVVVLPADRVERGIGRVPRCILHAALYGASAVFATCAALQRLPALRTWGRIAFGPYLVAALLAGASGIRSRRRPVQAESLTRYLAVSLVVCTLIVPLVVEVAARTSTGAERLVQPEARVVEDAAAVLAHESNPYTAHYGIGSATEPNRVVGPLPYLPAMLVFGVWKVALPWAPMADARVAFAAFTLLMVAVAIGLWRGPGRLLAILPLVVLPTGTMALVTGGDDIPVQALMLLALVMLSRRRPIVAGILIGLAASMKQLAWPMVPLVALASKDRDGEPVRSHTFVASLAVMGLVLVPFAGWDLKAFVDDVVRFPLGAGPWASPAASPTLGHLLVTALPDARPFLLAVLPLAAIGGFAILCLRGRPWTPARVAGYTGAFLAVTIVFGASTRFGLLSYPLDLALWGWLLTRDGPEGLGARPDPRLAASSPREPARE